MPNPIFRAREVLGQCSGNFAGIFVISYNTFPDFTLLNFDPWPKSWPPLRSLLRGPKHDLKTRPSRPTMRPLWINVFYEWMFFYEWMLFMNVIYECLNDLMNELLNVCYFYWVRTTLLFKKCMIWMFLMYDRWNNIRHYTQTEKYGRGPCEPSLTSFYAHH